MAVTEPFFCSLAWNFTWDGQPGLGHLPLGQGGVARKERWSGMLEGSKRPEAG